MKKCNRIFLILILLLFSINADSQTKGDPAVLMLKFLQNHTDTSLVIISERNYMHLPPYYILTKVGDTFSAFVYTANYKTDKKINSLPKVFRDTITRLRYMSYITTPVGINNYFNPYYIAADSLKISWNKMKSLDLWNIKDDAIEGSGCPVLKGEYKNDISDLSTTHLYLITPTEIKELYFIGPSEYEEMCPGRKGRLTILKVRQIFFSLFK